MQLNFTQSYGQIEFPHFTNFTPPCNVINTTARPFQPHWHVISNRPFLSSVRAIFALMQPPFLMSPPQSSCFCFSCCLFLLLLMWPPLSSLPAIFFPATSFVSYLLGFFFLFFLASLFFVNFLFSPLFLVFLLPSYFLLVIFLALTFQYRSWLRHLLALLFFIVSLYQSILGHKRAQDEARAQALAQFFFAHKGGKEGEDQAKAQSSSFSLPPNGPQALPWAICFFFGTFFFFKEKSTIRGEKTPLRGSSPRYEGQRPPKGSLARYQQMRGLKWACGPILSPDLTFCCWGSRMWCQGPFRPLARSFHYARGYRPLASEKSPATLAGAFGPQLDVAGPLAGWACQWGCSYAIGAWAPIARLQPSSATKRGSGPFLQLPSLGLAARAASPLFLVQLGWGPSWGG